MPFCFFSGEKQISHLTASITLRELHNIPFKVYYYCAQGEWYQAIWEILRERYLASGAGNRAAAGEAVVHNAARLIAARTGGTDADSGSEKRRRVGDLMPAIRAEHSGTSRL